MIDGVYPSQFSSVEAMRNSHYRNMHNIQNSSSKRISWLSPEYMRMTYRKKTNHVPVLWFVGKLAVLHQEQ